MEPIFALGPSQGARKEPEEPILRHLGRVPFSTLILDPKNHQKSSNARTPEPRKLSSRFDGSSIFTFSQVSYPSPKLVDFGSSFGSLLGAFWLLFGLLGTPWELLGHSGGLPRNSFVELYFHLGLRDGFFTQKRLPRASFPGWSFL